MGNTEQYLSEICKDYNVVRQEFEPTIVNEVEVQDCDYVFIDRANMYGKQVLCYGYDEAKCEDVPNCLFKQLQRKIKQCNEYKQLLSEIKLFLEGLNQVTENKTYIKNSESFVKSIENNLEV